MPPSCVYLMPPSAPQCMSTPILPFLPTCSQCLDPEYTHVHRHIHTCRVFISLVHPPEIETPFDQLDYPPSLHAAWHVPPRSQFKSRTHSKSRKGPIQNLHNTDRTRRYAPSTVNDCASSTVGSYNPQTHPVVPDTRQLRPTQPSPSTPTAPASELPFTVTSMT